MTATTTDESPHPVTPARRSSRRAARARVQGRFPVVLWIPAALGMAFLVLPLAALVVRAPWAALAGILTDPLTRSALLLSLGTATAATTVAIVLGVPLALVLARAHLPGRRLLRTLVTVPVVLPPVVGGVALLLAYGRTGVAGQYLELWFGLSIPFTTVAVVLAQTFVAMPFFVLALDGALATVDDSLAEAAATLGASRLHIFLHVTLPTLAPALLAGAVLCWARALGEFGATITFAGNLPGSTQTMPLAVYLALQSDPDTAVALSLVLLTVAVLVLVLLRDRWLQGVVR
ncbi:ABC transporter permease [Sanguibacter antarcticus]|uniref:Molybdenum transport system permease n=1 Tax=Sanguibacter antarcticus TaxID=372484 RepID=A0A2A9E4Q6_9MICO|nr:ABC transporter permease [Sanguibacter antarcticus]PFG33823.1 molybdate transport system permease protein [Sanguibacter antarcticus]